MEGPGIATIRAATNSPRLPTPTDKRYFMGPKAPRLRVRSLNKPSIELATEPLARLIAHQLCTMQNNPKLVGEKSVNSEVGVGDAMRTPERSKKKRTAKNKKP
jgi:hypothetical protein